MKARRLGRWAGLAAAVAVLGAPPAWGQAPPTLEAWPRDRLGGDADRDGVTDGSVTPEQALDARIDLVLNVTGEACRPGARFAWRIDGQPVTPAPAGDCRFTARVQADADHTVELETGNSDDPVRFELTVPATEHLVVSLGDSVASGEGNPDRRTDLNRARWLQRSCHRSLRSGHAQAAIALEAADRRSAVTFVPLGCSGATVTRGLLAPYVGIEPNRERTEQPPQVDLLNDLAGRRPVDAVVISVGANDVHFGNIVQFCAAADDCPRRRFDSRSPDGPAADPAAPTLDDAVTAALARLRDRYRDLDVRLAPSIPRERVLLVEYFNPTRGPGGRYCAPRLGLGKITADESRWAHERVLGRLNAVVAEAAAEHGWSLVEGIDESFDGHGICAGDDDRWVRTPLESFFRQDALPAFTSIAGTLHPNGRGHIATGRLIRPALAGVLGVEDLPPVEEEPIDDGESTLLGMRTVLLVALVVVLAIAITAGVIALIVRHRRRRPRSA